MTKRQWLIAHWAVCRLSAEIENTSRGGLPQIRCDWDGFSENAGEPPPTLDEVVEVGTLTGWQYHGMK